jgi:hypothetical protein
MITRAQMPRQLRDKGGIASITPRENYGLGSKIKERFRKLIPNELADVAVKAAPFVAPFNPGIAGLMRGIGRFDQRGSISDALKQGAATFGFGAGARALGGAPDIFGGGLKGGFTSPLSGDRTTAIKNLFTEKDTVLTKEQMLNKQKDSGPLKKVAEKVFENVPFSDKLSTKVKEKLLVGGLTSGASALYSYFTGEFEPQQPGETVGEYLARRNERVKLQMRQVMDSYYTPLRNPEYAAMTPEQKDNFIDSLVGQAGLEGTTDFQGEARATGGRVGYQTGGITMANTLAENIRRNLANQAAVAQQFQAARSRLPGYVAPQRIAAPTPTPVKKPIIDQPPPVKIKPMPIDAPTKIIIPEEKPIIDQPPPVKIKPMPIDAPTKIIIPEEKPIIDQPPPVKIQPMPIDAPTKIIIPEEPPKKIIPEEGTIGPINLDEFEPRPQEEFVAPIEEIDQIDMTRPPGTPIGMEDSPLIVMPIYNNPLPRDELLSGFEQFKKDNPEVMQGAGTAAIIPATLPGGYDYTFSGSLEANAFKKYLESIGQAPYQKRAQPIKSISGGLSKLAGGGMPTGIMKTNKAGVMERDYRDKGGFVPVGIKEKADDVPAMLSKNEFVFTADAVRGAGNGSIEKGAQRMYDTMKNLEKRVV